MPDISHLDDPVKYSVNIPRQLMRDFDRVQANKRPRAISRNEGIRRLMQREVSRSRFASKSRKAA